VDEAADIPCGNLKLDKGKRPVTQSASLDQLVNAGCFSGSLGHMKARAGTWRNFVNEIGRQLLRFF